MKDFISHFDGEKIHTDRLKSAYVQNKEKIRKKYLKSILKQFSWRKFAV